MDMSETSGKTIEIVPAGAAEAPVLAALHIASWRSAYRGILSDAYLDGAIEAERQAAWAERFTGGQAPHVRLALADGRPVGFIALVFEADPVLGTLIDNFHMLPAWKGRGIGRRLWQAGAEVAAERAPDRPVYLTAFADNQAARAVYRRLGGHEEALAEEQGKDGRWQRIVRFTWQDPAYMLAPPQSRQTS